jgi:hypothetical protein
LSLFFAQMATPAYLRESSPSHNGCFGWHRGSLWPFR